MPYAGPLGCRQAGQQSSAARVSRGRFLQVALCSFTEVRGMKVFLTGASGYIGSAVEERVLAGARRGIRSIVIRPAIVYGRGGGIPATFVESARKEGAARFIGSGENRWPLVHVDDLADLYLLALEKAPPGTLLLGVSGPSHSVRDVAAAASRGAGAEGRIRAWPLEEARKKLGPYADALVLDQQ